MSENRKYRLKEPITLIRIGVSGPRERLQELAAGAIVEVVSESSIIANFLDIKCNDKNYYVSRRYLLERAEEIS